MSKIQILKQLKTKGITPLSVKYARSAPTPYGYAQGWDLEFQEVTEDDVYDLAPDVIFSEFMEFDNLQEVLSWVETLPYLKEESS